MLHVVFPMLLNLVPTVALCPPEEGDEQLSQAGRPAQTEWQRKPAALLTRGDGDGDEADDDAEDHPIPAGGPWLGIQFGPVPEAMAGHLKSDGGLIVLNVAEHSPADEAGLEQHDVLISIDGHAIQDGDIRKFMDRLKEYKPGQSVEMRVLRDGDEKALSVRLGTRPTDVGQVKYRYKIAGDLGGARVESITPRLFEFRDGKLSKPDGEAADRFRQMLPDFKNKDGQWLMELPPGSGGMSVMVRQDQDGATLQVRREMDGSFSVTRTKPDGSSTKATYENAKAFKKGDADAHKFFSSLGDNSLQWKGGMLIEPGKMGNFTFKLDGLDEQTKDAMKDLGKLERMFDGHTAFRGMAGGGAGYSFHKQSDGSIRVTNRGGGDELIEEFRNEQSLKRDRPDLYKRYARLNKHEGKDSSDND